LKNQGVYKDLPAAADLKNPRDLSGGGKKAEAC